MKVLIATVQIPFVRGGAENLAEGLNAALLSAGHQSEIVALPFKWYPPARILDQMLASRLFDLSEFSGERVDTVIGLKFPAYLMPHPRKKLWLLHQHRTAYDLWGSHLCDLRHEPDGSQIRQVIINADNQVFQETPQLFTISENVSRRLMHYNRVDSTPVYHPPKNAERFHCASAKDYLFFPSRITKFKRQELVIQAIAKAKSRVTVIFSGKPDFARELEDLMALAARLGVLDRITFTGEISEEAKIEYYAGSLAVIYPPLDEDYGYCTLEAMLSSKAVITLSDSGGPLEFVEHGETGLVVTPTPESLADALDTIWENRSATERMGRAGRERYDLLNITWKHVLDCLLHEN